MVIYVKNCTFLKFYMFVISSQDSYLNILQHWKVTKKYKKYTMFHYDQVYSNMLHCTVFVPSQGNVCVFGM
jgi:hypothetical protein